MRATRAYIASAGTAAVMLGASLAMFALVSAFVAFGSWPGGKSATEVDQVVLNDVVKAKPKTVAVRADAVLIARRIEQRRVAAANRQAQTRALATTPAGAPVAQVPAGTTAPSAPAGAGPTTSGAAAPLPKQTQDATKNIDQTTRQVGTQVQQQVQNTQSQVNDVVNQVIGGKQPDTGGTVQKVTDTAGSILKH